MEMLDRVVRPRGEQRRKLDVYELGFVEEFHEVLTYIYVEFCTRKRKPMAFMCKTCYCNWCEEEKHDFDSKKVCQVFGEDYNDIKNGIDMQMLHNLCELLFDFIDQPRPEESITFVNELLNKSSDEICSLHKELVNIGEKEHLSPNIKAFVEEVYDRHNGYTDKLSRELFLWFLDSYVTCWK